MAAGDALRVWFPEPSDSISRSRGTSIGSLGISCSGSPARRSRFKVAKCDLKDARSTSEILPPSLHGTRHADAFQCPPERAGGPGEYTHSAQRQRRMRRLAV